MKMIIDFNRNIMILNIKNLKISKKMYKKYKKMYKQINLI